MIFFCKNRDKISENLEKSQKITFLKEILFAEKRLVFEESFPVQPVSESRLTKKIPKSRKKKEEKIKI